MRSIESRIITLFILFILGVQIVGFMSLQSSQESKARFAMETELVSSEQAIQRLLDQYTVKLTEEVVKLVNSNDFVQSVLPNSKATLPTLDDHQNPQAADSKVESVLAAQAARLNASAGLMISTDGQIHATSSRQLSSQLKQASTSL